MLTLNISIVTLKLAGKRLPLELHFAALDGLAFIYDDFFASYIPPFVKLSPVASESLPIEGQITDFLQQSNSQVLPYPLPSPSVEPQKPETQSSQLATAQGQGTGRDTNIQRKGC